MKTSFIGALNARRPSPVSRFVPASASTSCFSIDGLRFIRIHAYPLETSRNLQLVIVFQLPKISLGLRCRQICMGMPPQTNLIQAAQDQASIYARKRRVFGLIQKGSIGAEVLDELLPDGQPHLFEKSLWDYKEELTILPLTPSQMQINVHNAKMYDIIKDVVAFYNSFGGYLIVGVKDNPRILTGFQGQFDCGDLVKRVKGATQHSIECHYAIIPMPSKNGVVPIAMLHIPRRSDNVSPAQFLKDAVPNPNGRQAYKRNDIYLRDGDQSRPSGNRR